MDKQETIFISAGPSRLRSAEFPDEIADLMATTKNIVIVISYSECRTHIDHVNRIMLSLNSKGFVVETDVKGRMFGTCKFVAVKISHWKRKVKLE